MSHEPASTDGKSGGAEPEHLEHDFTQPLTPPVARMLRVFFVLCALLFLVDFFIDRSIHQPAERIPGFYGIYGFVGCTVLVLVAKQMRKVVMRDEDYYERLADESESEGGKS